MVTSGATNSRVGQSLPWFVAAVLVVAGSGLIALWLNNTASRADQDTLERGAAAIASNVEEQIRILQLAGTGAGSLSGQPVEAIDLEQLVTQIDISVLTSLLAVVAYPVTEEGAGPGEFVLVDLQDAMRPINFSVPAIELSSEGFDELVASGDSFISSPFTTDSGDRLDYVLAVPAQHDGSRRLVGIVFRPDRMLSTAVDAAGEGQYAVELIDTRFDDLLVVAIGEPVGNLDARRSLDGVKAAFELVVRPGTGFPFVRSPWISRLVIGTGIVIALLLIWMGHMARARAEELAERLRLAQELNESKDRFLATVSHELRTPLTVVLGVASEVGPNWEDFNATDRQDLMTMMIEQASEAANIVEDLLVAARSDTSRLRLAMEQTNLLSHVEYALASLPDDSRHRVTCGPVDRTIYADSTRLRQILRNLLENAVKYGGPDIHIESSTVAGRVQVVVSDNGSGLTEADIVRIFEAYEQSAIGQSDAPTGVGIGLYVSRLLARLMDGDLVCVRDEPRTIFRLTLAEWGPAEDWAEHAGVVGA